MVNELALSTDINVITAEINAYQRMAGEAIFEIGRRLKHVKENDLVHGEFGKWLEKLEVDKSVAAKFIKVYDEIGNSNVSTYTHLGLNALHQIAMLTEEQREKPHTIPSTGETKTVDEMTVKELREVKKKLKEEEEYKKLLEEENNKLSSQLQQERNKPQQVKTEVVERVVEVDKTDYTQLQKLQRDAESYKRKFESAERMKELLETRLKQEEADADAHRKLKDEIESLQSQKGDMYRQMESAKILGEFQAKVEAFLLEELAPKVYSKFREEIGESQVLSESFLETLDKIDEWLKDMRYAVSSGKSVKNMGEIIEAEVIEYE